MCKVFVQNKLVYLYNHNKFVNKYVDLADYGANFLYAILQYRRIEPNVKSWTCVSALVKYYYTYNKYVYTYNEVYNSNSLINLEDYKESLQTVKEIVKSDNAIAECLITIKIDGKYVHRLCNPSTILNDSYITNILLEPSNVRFLSIEYHASDCSYAQVLEIDKNELLINNEILSASYIKRALEYQIPYHRFNNKYTILLMDNNLKTVSLREGEYIVLHKNYYSIMGEEGLRENIIQE